MPHGPRSGHRALLRALRRRWLLCSHPPPPPPAVPRAAAAKSSSSSGGGYKSFTAGKPAEALGLNPAKTVRAAPAQPRSPGAVKKHKQWLKDLQDAKRELEDKLAEEQRVKDEKRRRFKERERRMRETVRSGGAAAKEEEYDDSPRAITTAAPRAAQTQPASRASPRRAAGKDDGVDVPSSPVAPVARAAEAATARLQAEAKSVAAKVGKRPAWTLTQEGAKEQEAKEEEEEVDDLLGFVEDLNFEEFVGDLEVQTALRAVKERVSALRSGTTTMRDSDAIAAAAAEAAAARRARQAETFDVYESALGGEGYASVAEAALAEEEAEEQRLRERASRLLSESERLRSVHSRASLESAASAARAVPAPKPKAFAAPRVVSHDDEFSGGTRLTNKSETSRLPYLNRNPAV